VRHALVPIHLLKDARAAGASPVEHAPSDAPAEPRPADERRPRRLATLVHRARVLVARTT
jgi:hypothetical protein